jgi:hypothetical protein
MSTVLIARIVYSAIIAGCAGYAVYYVWTNEVDLWGPFKAVAERIPIVKKESRWQPPELRPEQDTVYVQVGMGTRTGGEYHFKVAEIKKQPKSYEFHGDYPVKAKVANNRLLIDATFQYSSGFAIEFKGSVPYRLHPKFYWRAGKDGIEVLGPENEIVCQIFYMRENWVCLTGLFMVKYDPTNPTNTALRGHGGNPVRGTELVSAKDLKLESIVEKR